MSQTGIEKTGYDAIAKTLHIGAALWHHYRDKNNVLMRMLPFAKS